jgi:hypothetical protein
LTNIESTANGSGILLISLRIDEDLLGLYDAAGLALVKDTEHLAPDFEFPAVGSNWERLIELNLSLSIYDTARIELGYAGYGDSCRSSVKIDYFLIRMLEREDDGISRERCEGRM